MPRYIPVASALVVQDGAILLLRRSAQNKHFVHAWQVPEGKIERGETPAQALARELHEELGCSVRSLKWLGQTQTQTADSDTVVERHIFLVAIAGSIVLSKEHDTYRWREPAQLQQLMLYPGTESAIAMRTP